MIRPYDPNEASLYGEFVQAAYTMYAAAPNNLTPPQSQNFPTGYQMVAWIQMRDFVVKSTAPLFYGFIAQSQAAPDQFVVAIRGTTNLVEWWDDFNALGKTPFKVENCGNVGAGFARIYDTLEVIECPAEAAPAPAVLRSMQPAGGFAQQVSALIRRRTTTRPPAGGPAPEALPPHASVEVTGHSLGAALATLYTMENAHTERITNPMLCTFASPLVGDAKFAEVFNELGLSSWRIDNVRDLVTKVPPVIFGFVHVDEEQQVDSTGKVTPNFGCWHSLATYLSLIDPAKQPDADCQRPLRCYRHRLFPPLSFPDFPRLEPFK